MDYSIIVLTCCVGLFAHAAHIPEVYENNSPKQTQDKYEKPPGFNYQEYQKVQKGNQFDPQRVRYQQQQQLDTKPRQAKSSEFSTEISKPFTSTLSSTLSSTSGTVTSIPSRLGLEDIEKESPQNRVPKKIAKKSLKPNSYLVNEEDEPAGSRQDDSSYINYVDRGPKVLSQNLGGFSIAPSGGDQLTALSSLLGQTPENQLHGLQQLLNERQHGQHQHQGGYYKDHTPIKEDYFDIPNNQKKQSINLSHQSQAHNNHVVNQALQSLNKHGNGPDALKSLQAQLDATASAHAENIIAQAQKKALEHVKAQHEAIARAQKQAEHVALEQIKVQNEALARAHAQAEQEAEEQRAEEAKQKEKEEKRKAAERRRQQEQARERARIAALAYKHKQEQEQKNKEEQKDDAHSVAQNTRAKNSQKHKKYQNVEASETQNHYFTTHAQPHAQFTPVQLFPQAVAAPVHHAPVHHLQAASAKTPSYEHKPKYNAHEDNAEVDKFYIPPQFTVIGHTKNAHGEQELQYAANYEFGYRIRDYDHGNDYGHKESKDGETTKGEYHALLPDGRMQTVSYYVDDSGYHAEVTYGGESTQH